MPVAAGPVMKASIRASGPAATPTGELRLLAEEGATPLRQPWRRLITVGRAHDLLRADLVGHLRFLQRTIGYDYCRFHATFHDDLQVVTRDKQGRLACHWHLVDRVYDTLRELGLKPFVELNPMPAALASGSKTMFAYKMNVTPPRDFAEWAWLTGEFARHMIARHGLAEVRTWYFEVWNEPNLGGFWTGTQEDYWRLYDASARALKAIDPGLRVGGPASAKGEWVVDLIAHCAERAVPLDFVSTHHYPQDEQVLYPDRAGSPHAPGEFFADRVRAVREAVRASAKPGLEVHWTEWNTQSAASRKAVTWLRNEYVDTVFSAGFIVKACLDLDEAGDSLGWWVASDVFEEAGLPTRPFSCTYGLVTVQGIPKASYHAFRLLAGLRGERMKVEFAGERPAGCGGAATREPGRLRALLWNQPPLEAEQAPGWAATLRLPKEFANLRGEILAEHLSREHGSAGDAWIELGRPAQLTAAQEAYLRQKGEPRWVRLPVRHDERGPHVCVTLSPREVLALAVDAPVATAAPAAGGAEHAAWERAMTG